MRAKRALGKGPFREMSWPVGFSEIEKAMPVCELLRSFTNWS